MCVAEFGGLLSEKTWRGTSAAHDQEQEGDFGAGQEVLRARVMSDWMGGGVCGWVGWRCELVLRLCFATNARAGECVAAQQKNERRVCRRPHVKE